MQKLLDNPVPVAMNNTNLVSHASHFQNLKRTVLYRLSMGCQTVSPALVWVRIPGP